MNRNFKRGAAIGIAALTGLGLLTMQPSSAADTECSTGSDDDELYVVGLTSDSRLICFSEFDPRDADDIGSVVGLRRDTRLVGIDYRPATSELVGLGDAGGVYVIDDSTAQATLRSRLNVVLSGSSFGVDFNPTVDRLRIISDNGQNLRANVDTGETLVDATLTYPATPTAPATTATGVTGAAYTNNDSDPNTATTLYDIDSMLDQVVIQSPANAGLLAATGKLMVDTTATVGSDIYSTVRRGATVDVTALASLTTRGRSSFFGVTLFTGRASLRGDFTRRNQVVGIAIPLNQL